MEIKRDIYLQQLIDYQWDGQVKVITGIRRCGKSFLLNTLYKNHLIKSGIEEEQIIIIKLDETNSIKYRNPLFLAEHVRNIVEDSDKQYYLFIDEIQMSDIVDNPYNPNGKKITFYDALNDLKSLDNLDVYVTGSNSKMLSKDILTEFRGRADEIRMHPLNFEEFFSIIGGDKEDAFEEYAFYGGMPLILTRPNETAKMNYLKSLFKETYLKDIIERKKIEYDDVLDGVLDLLCSSVGSLTNPTKISNTINSIQKLPISHNTIVSYIDHLEDAFLFSEAKRYDVKGRSYFEYPYKFYCEDIGLRNARIGFRQQEMTHIMENIIYNDLICRGCSVDVGVVFRREGSQNVAKEIDFIAIKGGKKVYIQSAFALETEDKREAELESFKLTNDSFPKIIIRKDIRKRWYDDDGILNIGVTDFLLDKSII